MTRDYSYFRSEWEFKYSRSLTYGIKTGIFLLNLLIKKIINFSEHFLGSERVVSKIPTIQKNVFDFCLRKSVLSYPCQQLTTNSAVYFFSNSEALKSLISNYHRIGSPTHLARVPLTFLP